MGFRYQKCGARTRDKHFRRERIRKDNAICRDGRVVNARALRARGSQGPHGFESHSRRLCPLMLPDYVQLECWLLTPASLMEGKLSLILSEKAIV